MISWYNIYILRSIIVNRLQIVNQMLNQQEKNKNQRGLSNWAINSVIP